ncbi:hypothetical protein HY405_01220, partial [Candidatus Microgenomates bacterium]|nr:hypothetical protein [Candidatus Microgenomates bacterium]
MKRFFILAIFLLSTFYFIHSTSFVYAEGEFDLSLSDTYGVQTNGTTIVTHEITLTNLYSLIYAVSYSFILQGLTPENVSAQENGKNLPVQISQENKQTTLTVTFPDAVVGRGKSRTFTINYEDQTIAIKNGQVWDIT